MARRLTRSTAGRVITGIKAHVRRGPGRPRKNNSAEAHIEEESGPIAIGSNVTDETRLEFLERGRQASVILEEAKQALSSAHAVYTAIIKDAKRAGASEIAWTLKQLRRDPLEIRAEIIERNRMLRLAKIEVGTQLGLFDTPGETLADVVVTRQDIERPPESYARQTLVERIEEGLEAVEEALFKQTDIVGPPKPGPDDPGEPEEEDEEIPDQEPEEEEPIEVAKAGNEVLERSSEDQSAFLMGERARKLERAISANPFNDITSTHGAWIRGWKAEDARKAAQ